MSILSKTQPHNSQELWYNVSYPMTWANERTDRVKGTNWISVKKKRFTHLYFVSSNYSYVPLFCACIIVFVSQSLVAVYRSFETHITLWKEYCKTIDMTAYRHYGMGELKFIAKDETPAHKTFLSRWSKQVTCPKFLYTVYFKSYVFWDIMSCSPLKVN
jgi:hypothetical protein